MFCNVRKYLVSFGIQTLINTNHHESNPVAPYLMHLKGNAHINLSKYMKIHNLAHQSPYDHTCASVLLHMKYL